MIMQMLLNGSHLHPFLNRPDKPIAQLLMPPLGARGADFPPVLARNDSGEIYNEDRRRNHLISPCTHTHTHARTPDRTLSPDKLLLYLAKLLPCTQQGHTIMLTSWKVFPGHNMRLVSLSKHYCRGWCWEKERGSHFRALAT